LEQVQLNFSFRNKFKILHQCGLQKCAFLKVILATPIVVVMKTEMCIFNNNKIEGNEELMLVILNLTFCIIKMILASKQTFLQIFAEFNRLPLSVRVS
jgi:hypothetical protein